MTPENIRYNEAIGRPIRQDPAPEIGRSTFQLAIEAINRGDTNAAKEFLIHAKEESKIVHDMYVNWAWAFFTYIAKRYGEEKVEEAMRFVMESYFKPRYEKIMQADVKEQLDLCIEGMRGHFMGPGRMGEVEVKEDPEKYTLAYKPCGTGGVARQRIADGKESNPELFGSTQKPYPWSWGKTGVPYYCCHCAMVNEVIATEAFGHPMRITHWDSDPHKPCIWTIYKDAKKIPEEYYKRIGKEKPKE